MKNLWLQVRITNEDKQRLANIRRAEPDLPNESVMVRRLIERAERELSRRERARKEKE